jgi:hypothetical protein
LFGITEGRSPDSIEKGETNSWQPAERLEIQRLDRTLVREGLSRLHPAFRGLRLGVISDLG